MLWTFPEIVLPHCRVSESSAEINVSKEIFLVFGESGGLFWLGGDVTGDEVTVWGGLKHCIF